MGCKLPDHLFSCSDGSLYDTRTPQWHYGRPLRVIYSGLTRFIPAGLEGAQRIKAALRHGANWNYTSFFIVSDGAALSFESVRDNLAQVLHSTIVGASDGWRIIALSHSGECDEVEYCAHSGEPIWEE